MFKTKEIETNTLGDLLKSARKAARLALWQAAKKINIPLKCLTCFETGDYRKLPANVYAIAYLKKYAQILDLDVDRVVEQFKAERSAVAKTPEKRSARFIVTPKRLSLVLTLVAISLVFGYFWHQLSYLISPPAIKITQPASDLTTSEEFLKVSGYTEADVYLMINGKEIYVNEKGHFEDTVDLGIGLNILNIEAKDRLGKTSTVTRRVMVIK